MANIKEFYTNGSYYYPFKVWHDPCYYMWTDGQWAKNKQRRIYVRAVNPIGTSMVDHNLGLIVENWNDPEISNLGWNSQLVTYPDVEGLRAQRQIWEFDVTPYTTIVNDGSSSTTQGRKYFYLLRQYGSGNNDRNKYIFMTTYNTEGVFNCMRPTLYQDIIYHNIHNEEFTASCKIFMPPRTLIPSDESSNGLMLFWGIVSKIEFEGETWQHMPTFAVVTGDTHTDYQKQEYRPQDVDYAGSGLRPDQVPTIRDGESDDFDLCNTPYGITDNTEVRIMYDSYASSANDPTRYATYKPFMLHIAHNLDVDYAILEFNNLAIKDGNYKIVFMKGDVKQESKNNTKYVDGGGGLYQYAKTTTETYFIPNLGQYDCDIYTFILANAKLKNNTNRYISKMYTERPSNRFATDGKFIIEITYNEDLLL